MNVSQFVAKLSYFFTFLLLRKLLSRLCAWWRILNFGRDKAIVDCGSSSVSIGIGIGTGTGIGTGICHLSIRSSKQQTIVGAYYFAVLEALR